MDRNVHSFFLAFFLAAVVAAAADAPAAVPDVFDPAAGRTLKVGEWVEYLVAIPVDPLENSLRPDPVPPPAAAPTPDASASPAGLDSSLLPVFDPPESWLALPLRLEVVRVDEEGLRVHLTFGGKARDVFLPLREPDRPAPFRYEAPQPPDEAGVHRVNGRDHAVTVTRRRESRAGFVRLASPELPFGLARFATENIDISLVGMGEGRPPAFPLPEFDRTPTPAPGLLFRNE